MRGIFRSGVHISGLCLALVLAGCTGVPRGDGGRGVTPDYLDDVRHECVSGKNGGVNDRAGAVRSEARMAPVPDLVRRSDVAAVYRLTWLRALQMPYVMTFTVYDSGRGQVETRGWVGQIGGRRIQTCEEATGKCFWPMRPRLVSEGRIEIVPNLVKAFETLVAEQRYWSLAQFGCAGGHDGSTWILEASDGERYHYVDRWYPRDGEPLQVLGAWIIEHSALVVGDVY